jgi:hypothetical protein
MGLGSIYPTEGAMPRSGFADFMINVIAGVLALAILAGIGYFLWNAGMLDPVFGVLK